jgi:hypothetical protein
MKSVALMIVTLRSDSESSHVTSSIRTDLFSNHVYRASILKYQSHIVACIRSFKKYHEARQDRILEKPIESYWKLNRAD